MGLRLRTSHLVILLSSFAAILLATPVSALAAGESDIVLPDLRSQQFFGLNGHTLLTLGLAIAALGIVFGLVIYSPAQGTARPPVDASRSPT